MHNRGSLYAQIMQQKHSHLQAGHPRYGVSGTHMCTIMQTHCAHYAQIQQKHSHLLAGHPRHGVSGTHMCTIIVQITLKECNKHTATYWRISTPWRLRYTHSVSGAHMCTIIVHMTLEECNTKTATYSREVRRVKYNISRSDVLQFEAQQVGTKF